MLHTCATLATCQLRASRETSLNAYILSFFTLSHTQPLHYFHLNTEFLHAELQANLARNKANTWLIKFNLTISPFSYSVIKHPKTDSRLKREFGNNGKTHSHLNLESVMHLEQNTYNPKHLHKTH